MATANLLAQSWVAEAYRLRDPSPAMIGWQRLAKLLVLRAGLALSQGDPWSAASDWQRVLTLGARVEQALEGMDPIDKEVLVLRHFEQLSNDEVASVAGVKKAAASRRYVRALKRFREAMEAVPGFLY